jgi:hypothetical protein
MGCSQRGRLGCSPSRGLVLVCTRGQEQPRRHREQVVQNLRALSLHARPSKPGTFLGMSGAEAASGRGVDAAKRNQTVFRDANGPLCGRCFGLLGLGRGQTWVPRLSFGILVVDPERCGALVEESATVRALLRR